MEHGMDFRLEIGDCRLQIGDRHSRLDRYWAAVFPYALFSVLYALSHLCPCYQIERHL